MNTVKKVSFFNNINLDENTGCWNWTGNRTNQGYGMMWYQGKIRGVHRIAANVYLRFDINSPLEVCHKCDNPPCFNPKHFFIGTRSDNQRDAVLKRRNKKSGQVECIKGHSLSGENLYLTPDGRRQCKFCGRERNRKWWFRRKI